MHQVQDGVCADAEAPPPQHSSTRDVTRKRALVTTRQSGASLAGQVDLLYSGNLRSGRGGPKMAFDEWSQNQKYGWNTETRQ